jgi:hypothetical protein
MYIDTYVFKRNFINSFPACVFKLHHMWKQLTFLFSKRSQATELGSLFIQIMFHFDHSWFKFSFTSLTILSSISTNIFAQKRLTLPKTICRIRKNSRNLSKLILIAEIFIKLIKIDQNWSRLVKNVTENYNIDPRSRSTAARKRPPRTLRTLRRSPSHSGAPSAKPSATRTRANCRRKTTTRWLSCQNLQILLYKWR